MSDRHDEDNQVLKEIFIAGFEEPIREPHSRGMKPVMRSMPFVRGEMDVTPASDAKEPSPLPLPMDMVPKYQQMDPETEELFYADHLMDGMRVIVEPSKRYFIDSHVGGADQAKMIPVNRWCKVTKLRVEGDQVFFIGVYSDRTKTVRQSHRSEGWIVKKDSITLGMKTMMGPNA